MNPKTTGAFIAALRKEKNLTQKQLADKLNVSDKAISRWETGKGYPDIEFLMELSQEFSVSINELLSGKRNETPAMAQAAEKDIACALIQTSRKKRISSAIAIVLAVVIVILSASFIRLFVYFYDEIIGSSNCVVAQDYSYISLFNQRYIPLELDGVECSPSECLIKEAQVEGESFFGKLLFGEMIYSVKQCQNNEIIYLQTEAGPLATQYYCVEEKKEEYIALSQQAPYNMLTAQIITKDWGVCEVALEKALVQMLINKDYTASEENCAWSRGDGDESITVQAAQKNSPFIKIEGELLRKQGVYYWFDYDDILPAQNNADYSVIMAYKIDVKYYSELDKLFSFMFQ